MTTEAEVVPLASPQIREAGEVLGRAFHDDPFWSWVLQGESKRARVLPWLMIAWARYGLRHGEVYTTADAVKGVAIWIPPGKYPLSVVGMMLTGMILAPLKLRPAAFRRLMDYSTYVEQLHRRDVPLRHWYLMVLGVDPPQQGQGVGSALIGPALALADAGGLPCYLETEKERNVPFYVRRGFEVVVEDDLPRGGPHFWTMKREPKDKAA